MTNQSSQQLPMGIIDFARLVIDVLEASGVDYMLAGALAVAAWAEARSTQDVDIVVNVPIERMGRLSKELEKRDIRSDSRFHVTSPVLFDFFPGGFIQEV